METNHLCDRLEYLIDNHAEIQVKAEPLKGVTIAFGRVARDGSWDCYVSLPDRIKEKPPGHWMHNPRGNYFWGCRRGKTRDEAFRKAMDEVLGPALHLLLGPAVRMMGGKEVRF